MEFILQLIVSFLVGGIFIALQTLIVERVPQKWRGIILTIPSTMALSLFFVGFTKTPLDAVEAAQFIPASLGVDYIFVFIFAMLSRFNFFTSLFGGMLVLIFGAWFLFEFPPQTFFASTIFYFIPLILLAYLGVRQLPQSFDIKIYPMNAQHIFFRSLIGGTVIGLTVFLAKTISNFWGGIFSAFPAAFTSTFIIYYHLQGKAVIPAVARSLFFPGSIGFIIYAWIVILTFPQWGIWWGTLAAYGVTLFYFWLFFLVSRVTR